MNRNSFFLNSTQPCWQKPKPSVPTATGNAIAAKLSDDVITVTLGLCMPIAPTHPAYTDPVTGWASIDLVTAGSGAT